MSSVTKPCIPLSPWTDRLSTFLVVSKPVSGDTDSQDKHSKTLATDLSFWILVGPDVLFLIVFRRSWWVIQTRFCLGQNESNWHVWKELSAAMCSRCAGDVCNFWDLILEVILVHRGSLSLEV